jgi:SpoIID/LytB domain protein
MGSFVGGRRTAVAVAVVAVAASGLVGALPAHADEVYPRPSSGTLNLTGHGWGHGHGMSQYGAYGAAQQGKTWQQIVDFYYPNTVRTAIGNPTIRVEVTAHLGNTTRLAAEPGLRASFGTGFDKPTSFALPTQTSGGATVREWRVVRPTLKPGVPSKPVLQYVLSTGEVRTSPQTATGPQINFKNDSGLTRAFAGTSTSTSRVYRGELRGALVGPAGAETLVPIAAQPLDTYLRSVVPSEMPSSWSPAALGAQAVAARSYANYGREHPRNSAFYDTCPTTACQVFNGYQLKSGTSVTTFEHATSNDAITATAGVVLKYNGATAFTEFSSSNGGWSSDGGKPYLIAQPDPYDGIAANPNHTWRATITAAGIQSNWPSIGTFTQMRITARDGNGEWGGRVREVVLEGTAGSVTVSGFAIQARFGLKSEWFKPDPTVSAPAFPRDLNGDGLGDVVAVNGTSGALWLYRGKGDGTLNPAKSINSSDWRVMRLTFTAGTWNGDRSADVMAVWPDGSLYVYGGTSTGISSGKQVASDWQVYNLALPVGDFDGDGCSDIMSRRADDGTLWLHSGTCIGGIKSSTKVGSSGWGAFTQIFSGGDFTGDKRTDVLVRTSSGSLYVYPGNGTGGFGTRRYVSSGWNTYDSLFSVGDAGRDGRADIYGRDAGGTLWVVPGNGKGGVASRFKVSSGWSGFYSLLR